MNNTPFEILKEYLFADLRKKKQPLEMLEIDNAISNVKMMIDQMGLELYLQIITNNKGYLISTEYPTIDWVLLRQEIERTFFWKLMSLFSRKYLKINNST